MARTDEIIENNKGLIQKHNGLKTPNDVNRAILDVLTDISETAAIFLDFMSFIYNRQIVTKKEAERMKQDKQGE